MTAEDARQPLRDNVGLLAGLSAAVAALIASAIGAWVTVHVTDAQISSARVDSVSTYVRSQRQVAYSRLLSDAESFIPSIGSSQEASKAEAVQSDVINLIVISSTAVQEQADLLQDDTQTLVRVAKPDGPDFDSFVTHLVGITLLMKADVQAPLPTSPAPFPQTIYGHVSR